MQTIKEKIRQRRSQMLVHSYIYYKRDDSIVDDHKWQEWANELADLQKKNPSECSIGFYDEEFKDWSGDTGNMLPLDDPQVINKSEALYQSYQKTENKGVQVTDFMV